MHKMSLKGPKHYIFGDYFYSANATSNLVRVPGSSQLDQNSEYLVNSVHFR